MILNKNEYGSSYLAHWRQSSINLPPGPATAMNCFAARQRASTLFISHHHPLSVIASLKVKFRTQNPKSTSPLADFNEHR